ncbi:MAG: hypothetical protein WCK01_03850 [Candidatus Uhrbacteria bacterium]
MADKKPKKTFEETVSDIGGAIGILVTAVMALARPHLVSVWNRIRIAGLNTAEFIRDCYDRTLVAKVLRPWLTVALSFSALLFVGQCYALARMSVPISMEGLCFFSAFGIAALVLMAVQRYRIHKVRDFDVNLVPAAGLHDQAQFNSIFGVAGLAPSTVLAILVGQTVVALQLGGIAVLLREMPFSHGHDPRISMVFMLVAVLALMATAAQYVVMARVVGWIIVAGAGIATTVVRAILRPILIALPFVDDDNVDEYVPEGLGFPRKEVGDKISTGHEYLFGVMAGWLACVIPEHNMWCIFGITMYAVVLLGVHKLLKALTGLPAEKIYNAIVITFVVFAPLALTRRLMMTSIWSDLRALGSMWTMLAHTDYLPLLVVGGGAVALGVLAYKYIPHKQVSYPLLYIGLFIGLLTLGLCAFHMVQESPLPGEARATTHASTPSAPRASAPRPPRSPSVTEAHGG